MHEQQKKYGSGYTTSRLDLRNTSTLSWRMIMDEGIMNYEDYPIKYSSDSFKIGHYMDVFTPDKCRFARIEMDNYTQVIIRHLTNKKEERVAIEDTTTYFLYSKLWIRNKKQRELILEAVEYLTTHVIAEDTMARILEV